MLPKTVILQFEKHLRITSSTLARTSSRTEVSWRVGRTYSTNATISSCSLVRFKSIYGSGFIGYAAHLCSLDSYSVIGSESIHGVDRWVSGFFPRARLRFLFLLRETSRSGASALASATTSADTFPAAEVPREESIGIMVVSCLATSAHKYVSMGKELGTCHSSAYCPCHPS